jgi:hypothetical protein
VVRRYASCLLLLALAEGHSHAQALPEEPGSEAESHPAQGAVVPEETSDPAHPLREAIGVRGNSSRLFYMPVADTVGAYEMTLSYDGSLLEEPGVLSSAGVFALGVGDLAQVDYRHTSAIGIEGGSVPLPSVGVQLKLPFDTGTMIPAIAISYRLGIEHEEGGAKEKATDVYGVAHFALPLDLDLHAGLRVTQASMEVADVKVESTEWYPAIGLAHDIGSRATTIIEFGRAPKFDIVDGKPVINSGVTGRLGLRWRVHPRFAFDASAGYLAQGIGTDPSELLAWDIRLGGEIFIPWGALACESLSLFCK